MLQLPLSEQPNHVDRLCEHFNLGASHGALHKVAGGFHHRMWRLATERGVYAVKQLAADIDVTAADAIQHYNETETIAEAFAVAGIAAIHARNRRGVYLQVIERGGYLVYPWTDAVALERRNLSETHALKVARLLARMHRADIFAHNLKDIPIEQHAEAKIVLLVQRAITCHARDSKILQQQLSNFLAITARQPTARQILAQRLVVSHGDLDQKNILWNAAGEPILIDWESACRINPTHEAMLVALDWSGITTAFEYPLFEKFMAAYQLAGGVFDQYALQAALDSVQGDWLNWLMFNVGRSFDQEDTEQRALGAEQVDLALATLLRLQRLRPGLVASINRQAAINRLDEQCLT